MPLNENNDKNLYKVYLQLKKNKRRFGVRETRYLTV